MQLIFHEQSQDGATKNVYQWVVTNITSIIIDSLRYVACRIRCTLWELSSCQWLVTNGIFWRLFRVSTS